MKIYGEIVLINPIIIFNETYEKSNHIDGRYYILDG